MTDQIEHGRVEDALTHILTSDKFAVAPQMSAFLNYVVHATLAGNANRIKAYTVAVDALGKPDSFDPQNDPSVRVLAKRLRSALDNYYLLFPDTEVIVEMKAGSYVPKFLLREERHDSPPVNREASPLQLSEPSRNVGLVPPLNAEAGPAKDSLGRQDVTQTHLAQTVASAPALQNQPSDKSGSELGQTPSLLSRVSRPAIAMAVASVLFMGLAINSQSPTARSDVLADSDVLPSDVVLAATQAHDPSESDAQPALAAAYSQRLATGRPSAPVIYVDFPDNDDPLDGQIADTISTVLARFDELDVRRTTEFNESRAYWPEEYRLLMSSLSIGTDVRIEAQLLHAESGRIVHSRTFTINEENLTLNDLTEIESFAAQLAQIEGPVFKDYALGGKLSERMSCFMSLQQIVALPENTQNTTAASAIAEGSSAESRLAELDLCLAGMSGDNRHQARALIYQAHARLISASLSEQQDVPGEVRAALSASREAISLLPFDAGAHTMLLMSLRATGDLSQAREFGERALELNPFDQQALRQMSILLEEMGEQERARLLLQKAETLRAQWSLSAL